MDPRVLIAVIVVAAIVSRPLDVWLWRRGTISDRTAAVALIGRFPVVVFLVMWIGGIPLALRALITIPLLVLARLFYPFTRTLMDDARQERLRRKPRENVPPN